MVTCDVGCAGLKFSPVAVAAGVLLAITLVVSATAQTATPAPDECPDNERPMTFTKWTNTLGQTFGQGSRDYIFADGAFCPNTPLKFQQFLEQNPPVPNTTIVFNSGGGNVQAGLTMGRLIRKQKMWTEIGSRFPLMIPQNENIDEDVVPYFPEPASPPFAGQCISSCSIAFLGGIVRTVGYASNYRVHQFTGGPQDTADDLQKADEELSARIVHYLSDMGISPNWIVYMAKRRGDAINLTIQQMRRLKVVTPRWATRWQITALPDNSGFYLDGATTDAWGTHDIAFTCPPKPTPSVAQAGSSVATEQKKPPAVVVTFSLDPGPHGSAADLISAVVGDDLEVSGNFDPRAFLRSAKKTPPTVVSNRLTSKWELAEPFVTAGLPYIGVAFIFDPAAKLPMRLLRFQGTLDNDLLKEFVATCH